MISIGEGYIELMNQETKLYSTEEGMMREGDDRREDRHTGGERERERER